MPILNMTSLVDIILMLVIFFMLTTSFARIQYMDLSIPSLGKPAKLVKATTSVLDLTSYGELRLDDRSIKMVELEEVLRSTFKRYPNKKILVKAGNEVTVQRLVSVLDTVYVAGGRSLAVDHLIEAHEVQPITLSPEGTEYSPQNEVDEFLAP